MSRIIKQVCLLAIFNILSCSSSKKKLIDFRNHQENIYELLSQLKPGDTMTFGPGVYDLELFANIPSGKSWSNPIVIRAIEGANPILKPKSGNRVLHFGKYYKNQIPVHHIEIDGLILDAINVKSDAVKITDGAHHIKLKNCEIRNAKNQGILIANEKSTHNEFINCTIHSNGITDFEHGIYITSDYNIIQNCEIYNNAGAGINIYDGIGSANFNLVENCHIYNNGAAGKRGAAIGIHTGEGNIARNNVIHDNKIGIHTDYGAKKTVIEDNIIFDHPGYDLIVGEKTSDCILRNNILLKETSHPEIQIGRTYPQSLKDQKIFSKRLDIEKELKKRCALKIKK